MDVDDTVVLILERIDSVVGLIRAASTCRRWRRIVADAGFLRRFRSLHGPHVAGDYYNGYEIPSWTTLRRSPPVFVPSTSIDARHFSLGFVVDACIFPGWQASASQPWYVLDSRGSLLLMECVLVHDTDSYGAFPKLVVCEPLTRSYKIIPEPPDFDRTNCKLLGGLRGPFLVDGDEDETGGRIGMSNFKVLCVLFSRNDGVALASTTVFTAAGDTDATWSEKAIDHMGSSRKTTAHPCEFSWPPVLQACLDR